jgi:hypothetical protein
MSQVNPIPDDEWIEHKIAAATEMVLVRYFKEQPNSDGSPLRPPGVKVSFESSRDDFVRSRAGVIYVDVADDGHYEVEFKNNDGLMSISPRSRDR